MAEEEEFQIRTGMDVVDPDGNRVGNLESILSEDRTGISRFIVVDRHVLPVETIDDVEGNRMTITIPKEDLDEFPERRGTEIPPEEDLRRAYEVIGLSGPLVGEPEEGSGPGM